MLGHAELSTTQTDTQVSIRALQAVHAATHPGATNSRHRRVPHPSLRFPDDESGDLNDGGLEQLLAVLETEKEEENRVPAEVGDRSAAGETTALDRSTNVEEDDHDHPHQPVYDHG